tara:strand:- start:1188 stop:1484 length:297 start_codon:yes stop_codon:yes gene_type:complete
MHEYITEYMFKDDFQRRRPDNFTSSGLSALFNYMEEYEEENGVKIEFDVIAICCEFSEYENFTEIQEAYSNLDLEDLEDLYDRTHVIEHADGIIIRDF